jgi:hypothetical protein
MADPFAPMMSLKRVQLVLKTHLTGNICRVKSAVLHLGKNFVEAATVPDLANVHDIWQVPDASSRLNAASMLEFD